MGLEDRADCGGDSIGATVNGGPAPATGANGATTTTTSPLLTNTMRRSKWTRLCGRVLFFMTIISFIFVGLIINLLQLLILLALQLGPDSTSKPGNNDTNSRNRWRSTLKRINGNLLYILFSPTISLIYYWARLRLNIQLNDVKLIEDSKKPMLAIILPNHSYELDYMVCFALADQLGNLGAYKSMSKDELKYLPVVGWGLWMSDIIFVKRNWNEDRLGMDRKLDQLFDYEQGILGVFAEGTRWTEEKYRESEKFALERGIKPFKYHLVPRKRGFTYTVRHYLLEIIQNKRMDEKLFRLFNMQIIMPDKPRFKNFLDGDQLSAHIYCEEVHLSPEVRGEILNSRDEEDCPKLNQLLVDIFRRKDEIVDEFYANGQKFSVDSTTGGPFPLKDGRFALIVWLLGLGCTYFTLIYLALMTHLSQSIVFWTLLGVFIGGCAYMTKRVETESKATKLVKLAMVETPATNAAETGGGTRTYKKVNFNCP